MEYLSTKMITDALKIIISISYSWECAKDRRHHFKGRLTSILELIVQLHNIELKKLDQLLFSQRVLQNVLQNCLPRLQAYIRRISLNAHLHDLAQDISQLFTL